MSVLSLFLHDFLTIYFLEFILQIKFFLWEDFVKSKWFNSVTGTSLSKGGVKGYFSLVKNRNALFEHPL
jgi:hypothetical protein